MSEPLFRSVSPILSVSNVDAAISFYESVLGFRLAWKWGTPPSVASVCRDEVELMLELSPAAVPVGPAKVYVVVASVESHYAKIVAAGARVTYPLAVRDCRMKDCRIVDPDGNEISFGEPVG